MGLATRGYRVLREEGISNLILKGSKFALHRTKQPFYRIGSGRVCPVCGGTGWKFMPAGKPSRAESECPTCGVRERHRLLWHYIENETELTDGNFDILYFAPTTQIIENLRAMGNTVTSVDLTMRDVDVRADITRLPFRDDSFDAVVCMHVLEHIPDDESAMSELYRVLKSGGKGLVMIPKDKGRDQTYEDASITEPEQRREAFGQEEHVRWYGKDFTQRLADAGFDVSAVTYADELDDDTVERLGLKVHPPAHRSETYQDRAKYEDIHIVRVPASE